MRPTRTIITLLLVTGLAVCARAQTVLLETVVSGLDNPSGIAVRPQTGEIFIATHPGVLQYLADGNLVKTFIGDYPNSETSTYGKGPIYKIGPLGLAFVDRDHLVVGDGSRPDGEELVRIYRLGPGLAQAGQTEANAVFTLGPITPGEKSVQGEGNFYGVAVGAGAMFFSCNGDDTKGWVAQAKFESQTPGGPLPGTLVPFIATKVATGVDAPVAVTFTPDGGELVIGQMGEINVPGDSLLTFYDPRSGELKRKVETGLHDITGLAYSPTTGKLYATDFAWASTEEGGLFELDSESGKTTKAAPLDKPTALTFTSCGELLITVFGTAKEDSTSPPGALLRNAGGL